MHSQAILEELIAVLSHEGVTIRRGPMGGGGGGLCEIKGSSVFFVDTECSPREMAAICAIAVKEIADTEIIYLRPQIRQFLKENGI